MELPGQIYFPSVEELAEPRKPITWVWANRIPLKKVTVLAGAGGTGKSTLLVGLMVARATRRSFLGVATLPGMSAFVSAEDEVPDYLRRFDAWRSVTPTLDLDAVSKSFGILPLLGTDTRIVRAKFGTYEVAYEVVDDLIAKATVKGVTMIVLETASRFGAGESNEASAALVSACERLAKGTGAAVVIVTHSGKDAARNRRQDQYAARGGSALVDNARSALVLTSPFEKKEKKKYPTDVEEEEDEEKEDDNRLILTARKVNDSAPVPDIMIEKVSTPYGLTLRAFSNVRQSPAELEMIAKATAEAERKRNDRWIAIVKQSITNLTKQGIEITQRMLREEYHGTIAEIPRTRVYSVVEMAIAAGAIFPGRKLKGGGVTLLAENSGLVGFTGSANGDNPLLSGFVPRSPREPTIANPLNPTPTGTDNQVSGLEGGLPNFDPFV